MDEIENPGDEDESEEVQDDGHCIDVFDVTGKDFNGTEPLVLEVEGGITETTAETITFNRRSVDEPFNWHGMQDDSHTTHTDIFRIGGVIDELRKRGFEVELRGRAMEGIELILDD